MSDNGLRKSMARFSKGFDQLSGAFQHLDYRYPNELEQFGLIRLFKGCFDSAWRCLRTFFYDQGYVHVEGSRDAVRLAFRLGVIGSDSSKIGEVWMDMIKKREQVELANDDLVRTNILTALMDDYYDAFTELKAFFHQETSLKDE
ncbi:nucleotidyltransferase substrate binding protein [Marinomonas sp. RSW2]|uniref:Nucleotidyltransferase substrate binding protein n=1 Tax=Marinomonas maritima TaxID=2940935 RepID=A0ABT5WHP0_9GAMM|nr:nucleotidyltransferase substrate binding protein [Marinomonas maritima]MDE8604332.1 nucleotidyltransferase substrate binding protein [Marinomonas maritima]